MLEQGSQKSQSKQKKVCKIIVIFEKLKVKVLCGWHVFCEKWQLLCEELNPSMDICYVGEIVMLP